MSFLFSAVQYSFLSSSKAFLWLSKKSLPVSSALFPLFLAHFFSGFFAYFAPTTKPAK
jgi:hypothetical protein